MRIQCKDYRDFSKRTQFVRETFLLQMIPFLEGGVVLMFGFITYPMISERFVFINK